MKQTFMLKIAFQIFFLLTVGQLFSQNKILGYWTGSMERAGSILKIADEFQIKDGKAMGFFNAVSQRASGIPLDSVVFANAPPHSA